MFMSYITQKGHDTDQVSRWQLLITEAQVQSQMIMCEIHGE